MATLNAIVQNTVMKEKLHGTLWSKVPRDRSLLGTSGNNSLVNPQTADTNTDYAKSFAGDTSSLNSKVRDYDESRNSFRSELKDRMASLQKANSGLKNLSREKKTDQNTWNALSQKNQRPEEKEDTSAQKENDITAGYLKEEEPKRADPDRETLRERLDAAAREDFDTIREFVKEFNSTVSYLNEGRDVSDRVSSLASSFAGGGEMSDTLDQIGISVGSGGELAVNSEKLAESLTKRPSTVDAALGTEGLAGRIDQKMDMASRQADRLFPSAAEALGGKPVSSTKSMYGGDSMPAANAATDVGSLFQKFG